MWLSNTSLYHCDKLPFFDLWFSCQFSRSWQIFYRMVFQSQSNLICFGKHFRSEPFSSLDPRQVRLQASKSFKEPKLITCYSTARVDVINCVDKFHTRRRRVVRRVHTIFLRARWKKNARFMCLCYSVLWVSVFSARSFPHCRQRKIYITKKSNHVTITQVSLRKIFWITSSSSRFTWFELLMNQLGRKMSLTQGIETRVSLSE